MSMSATGVRMLRMLRRRGAGGYSGGLAHGGGGYDMDNMLYRFNELLLPPPYPPSVTPPPSLGYPPCLPSPNCRRDSPSALMLSPPLIPML
jgi:hypothetical protein